MTVRPKQFQHTLIASAIGLALATPAMAQENAPRRAASALLEEVVVTARKREEGSQDVPVSVSAFGSDQLDALKIRNLTNLAVGMPNVVLDEIGTSRGYANFSIRGLGVNSSIPSIDPAVGVVVDGVYLGTNTGVVFDAFDLESIEVLRGPQGTLFGRNVTGGAILMNTKKPTQDLDISARFAYDQTEKGGGGNVYAMGSVSKGLTDNIAARLSVYVNDDEGGLDITEGPLAGQSHGAQEQLIIRPSIMFTPTDDLELIVRYEHQDIDADGPSAQTHTNALGVPGFFNNFDRDSFEFAIDNPGSFELEVDFLTVNLNWDVAGGTLTNVFGYRDQSNKTDADIDAQSVWIFHSDTSSEYEQWSNELRWNSLMFNDRANVTIGAYVFESELIYDEDRNLGGLALAGSPLEGLPFITQSGGGALDVESIGLFAAMDFDITERLQLTSGIRWSQEKKDARVVTVTANGDRKDLVAQGVIPSSECRVAGIEPSVSYHGGPEPICAYDFTDDDTWTFVSPKLGFMYQLTDSSRAYFTWSRGFRSGGYNLRNTEEPIVFGPGPFDTEQADSFELGFKTEWDRGQLNVALFRTDVEDMQREINQESETSGVLQLIQNTADAEIVGLEVDATIALSDSFTVKGSMGWMSSDYTEVSPLICSEPSLALGCVPENLSIPRLPDLTYSITAIHDLDLGSLGYVSSLLSYGFRDETFYTDDNRGFIGEQQQLDFAIDYHMAGDQWVFSLYGRNMMNTVRHGGNTQLSATLAGVLPWGGTFSPLNRPRTLGVEATYNF